MEEDIEAVEIEKTIQQHIRERGKLVHADSELNQDGLPVYFKMKIAGEYYLVVDMLKKDEMGVECPMQEFRVVNQLIAELIFELAIENKESEKKVRSLQKSLEAKPIQPFEFPEIPDPWPHKPYISFSSDPQPHVLEPQEIPFGTGLATMGGNIDETE